LVADQVNSLGWFNAMCHTAVSMVLAHGWCCSNSPDEHMRAPAATF
jgi:hypothetical protein